MGVGSVVGKIQTVLGSVSPESLGITLTHEHILADLSSKKDLSEEDWEHPRDRASNKGFYAQPVSIETIADIRHYQAVNRDNSQLMDIPTAIEEINLYKQYGGQSLVDATNVGLSRDPIGLARVSRASGVNVIMGSSYYVSSSHPSNIYEMSEAEITEQIVRDITEGVEDTQIKSGIIGEVGCSWPLNDNERKVLRASATAQKFTGAPMLIHPGRDEMSPLEIIEILAESGADLSHTIMGHLDRTVFLDDTLMQIADSGCYMEWDLFGIEESYYPANPNIDMPSDAMRMDTVRRVISQGYGTKIVISQDICAKSRLSKFGGHGYAYILRNIVPRMKARGFSEQEVEDILVNNPKNVLPFVSL